MRESTLEAATLQGDELIHTPIGDVELRHSCGFESNFIRTVGEDGWFVYFRLYAPLQPFFDKTFGLADVEPVEG